METIGGDGSETGLVIMKKGQQKSMTGISASLPWTTGIKRRAAD